ncbi:sugar transferase [Sulfurimonas sp.]|uniref:sugar transferase n=1 Tax=Sulfurimonas sp. TaxID=2022749 RepID=UPI0025CD2F7A|nr:sugar transferase [Sulfurimonas sp.]
MKNWINRTALIIFDLMSIFFAIVLAFSIRQWCNWFERSAPSDLDHYLQFGLFYAVIITLLAVEGIYSKRYDFWQEMQRIGKGVFLASIILLAFLAMTKQSESYSRFILIATFAITAIVLPLQKYYLKRLLFKIGTWKHESTIVGEDTFFTKHVFKNPYLGYVLTDQRKAKTLFISSAIGIEALETYLHEALIRKQEVVFVPLVTNFDFSDAHIIHLFNARSNLIIVENNLLNKANQWIKTSLDTLLSLLIFPVLLVFIGIIVLLIKREDGGSIFFKQVRLGEDAKEFVCYKFRSMQENSDDLLQDYLHDHPEEIENYEIYHKYENDPRITKIGAFLRKTSLDELPQIFNVLKGEMSLIGPRPYMPNERVKMGDNVDIILAVKPGITGLWQVSGRNDVDFVSRIDLDVWYVRNWSVWKDIVIFIKTVQVVLGRKGVS